MSCKSTVKLFYCLVEKRKDTIPARGTGIGLSCRRNVTVGVTASTVYSMMDEQRKDLSVATVKKLCDGLDLPISAFFADEIFDGLEQEIK